MNLEVQWPLVIFSLLAGSGGALAAFAGVAELTGKAKEGRFVALIVSLVLLIVGGCASVVHLALPQNVMAAATNIFSFSGISMELIMLGISCVVVFVYLILLKREGMRAACKVCAVLAIVAGVVLAFVCGHGYVIESRHYWDTELLPLAYMGSVLPVGAFAYMAIAKVKGAAAEDFKSLLPYMIAAVIISVLSLLAYTTFVGFDVAGRDAFTTWGCIVVCGIIGVVVCALLCIKSTTKESFTALACVAVVLALVGGVGVRVLMWQASDPFFNAWYIEQHDINIGTEDY